MMLFYFLAGVKNSEYYSSPSYLKEVSRLVYEFGVRYKEDSRPQRSYNSRTKTEQDKKNDIVTYQKGGTDDLYVLAKSGGVSLFDGMSSKVKLGKNDCWWVITKNAKIEEGLVIAKDMFSDSEGNAHYSIEPDRYMLLSEYIEKLEELKKYMKQKA